MSDTRPTITDAMSQLREGLAEIEELPKPNMRPIAPSVWYEHLAATGQEQMLGHYLQIGDENPDFGSSDLMRTRPGKTTAMLRSHIYLAPDYAGRRERHPTFEIARLAQLVKDKVQELTMRDSGAEPICFTTWCGHIEYHSEPNAKWFWAMIPIFIGGYEFYSPPV